jgi:hypothetical protein
MAAEFDLMPHARMWRDFTRLFKCGTCAMALCLILLGLFLVP